MALTQQLARVSPQYLAECRRAAADSPDNAPCWDPPTDDTVDLDWSMWGLIRFLRSVPVDAVHTDVLNRSVSGDELDGVAYLDHVAFYDGFDGPPALLGPAAVAEVARGLAAIDMNQFLALLPADAADAAQVTGFGSFDGDLRAYLADHFSTLRDFYLAAAARGLAVVMWVD
ncbi:DUF1877 family protein [Actinomycetota bacterium Odt1-20B]